ncbi:MAG: tol-pal system YbgF family protein [Oligoflexales bacterium]
MLRTLLMMIILLMSSAGFCAGRYSELVFHLSEPRPLHVSMQEASKTLILEIEGTHSEELKALEHYDETLIRRIIVKESPGSLVTLKIAFRDAQVRATVSEYKNPPRISIELFDDQYQKQTDPITGLPLPPMQWRTQISAKRFHADATVSATSLNSISQQTNRATKRSRMQMKTGTSHQDLSQTSNGPKRRLLQPAPKKLKQSKELAVAMKKSSKGRGPAWSTYPKYIFPMQVSALHGKKPSEDWEKKAQMSAVKDYSAMADYALQLFSFGHENRAFVAYQQVLFHDSSIFSKEPLHLWAFAETHFGQGNLTLAQGYYDAISERFPGKIYASMAQLRHLDIQAIQAVRSSNNAKLQTLVADLENLHFGKNDYEMRAQKELRKIWWTSPNQMNSHVDKFPKVAKLSLKNLIKTWKNVESRRSTFLSLSLILHESLKRKWDSSVSHLAKEWVKRYQHDRDPWVAFLLKKISKRVQKDLIQMGADEDFIGVIESWENIPNLFVEVKKNPLVAWSVAESYRKLGQDDAAQKFYEISKKSKNVNLKFKSYFWLAEAAARSQNGSLEKKSDQSLKRIWSSMTEEQKHHVRLSYQNYFVDSMMNTDILTIPSKIILETWEDALHSKVNQSDSKWREQYSPTLEKMRMLVQLRMKFQKLGLDSERRRTILLFKKFKPADLSEDQQIKDVWAEELISLAEEYRHADQLLKAGRLYAFTARESVDWGGRAEALYKGGLLLYKSGRREEAMKALTEASQDGDSLFYSNLAKERLRQLIQ